MTGSLPIANVLSLDPEQVTACNHRLDGALQRLMDLEGRIRATDSLDRPDVIDLLKVVQDILGVLGEIVNGEDG